MFEYEIAALRRAELIREAAEFRRAREAARAEAAGERARQPHRDRFTKAA
ncbi:hypothetical protein [Streptomyces sp. NPDC097619]